MTHKVLTVASRSLSITDYSSRCVSCYYACAVQHKYQMNAEPISIKIINHFFALWYIDHWLWRKLISVNDFRINARALHVPPSCVVSKKIARGMHVATCCEANKTMCLLGTPCPFLKTAESLSGAPWFLSLPLTTPPSVSQSFIKLHYRFHAKRSFHQFSSETELRVFTLSNFHLLVIIFVCNRCERI